MTYRRYFRQHVAIRRISRISKKKQYWTYENLARFTSSSVRNKPLCNGDVFFSVSTGNTNRTSLYSDRVIYIYSKADTTRPLPGLPPPCPPVRRADPCAGWPTGTFTFRHCRHCQHRQHATAVVAARTDRPVNLSSRPLNPCASVRQLHAIAGGPARAYDPVRFRRYG